jgi:hypothetical protein
MSDEAGNGWSEYRKLVMTEIDVWGLVGGLIPVVTALLMNKIAT